MHVKPTHLIGLVEASHRWAIDFRRWGDRVIVIAMIVVMMITIRLMVMVMTGFLGTMNVNEARE